MKCITGKLINNYPIISPLQYNFNLYSQGIPAVFRHLNFIHILLCGSLMLKLKKKTLPVFHLYSVLHNDKAKQNFRIFCKFIKKEKNVISYWCNYQDPMLWHWHISLDHLWDLFTSWLETSCGIFNWLDMIWTGTHPSI